jgi:hypothetical protein
LFDSWPLSGQPSNAIGLEMSEVPWFLPGAALSFGLGLVLSRRAGQVLRTWSAVAGALIVALGIIVSATLTPGRDALLSGALGQGVCHFERIGLASLADFQALNETSLNVILFVPLGVAIGLVPGWRRKILLAVGAFNLPVAIELIQLNLPVLDRACESADVVDNLTGLMLGLFAALVAGRCATKSVPSHKKLT